MRAVVVTPSEELVEVDVPEPVPGPGQVLLEVDAIGVGYVDVMSRRGRYFDFPGPGAVPGIEIVGRVTRTGPDTPATLTGHRFLALLTAFGGYAEKVVAATDRLLPVPAGLDANGAVAAGVNALVAECALDRARITAADRVLVLGASGGIGVLATQLARAHDADVTVVTSSAARGDRLRALGATRSVDRTRETLRPDGAYDVIVDTIAGPALDKHLELLRANGRYLLVGGAAGAPGPTAFDTLLRNIHKSPTLFAFSLNSLTPQDLQNSWKRILAQLDDGRLAPVLDQCFPLSEAEAALRRVEAGHPFGKVVLLPG